MRIPADVERPDKLLAGLTARQLAILAVAAVVLWAGYAATRHLVPVAVFGAVAVPVGAVAATAGPRAVRRRRRPTAGSWPPGATTALPRRLVPAPDGVPARPGFARRSGRPAAGPAAPPGRPASPTTGSSISAPTGWPSSAGPARSPSRCAPRPSRRRWWPGSPAGSTRSAEPVEILVRAEPVDLAPTIDALLDAAPACPTRPWRPRPGRTPGFLADLAAGRDLLRREVLVVLRQARPSRRRRPAGRLHRRAGEAATALAAAGVDPRRSRRSRRGRVPGPGPRPGRHRPDSPARLERPEPSAGHERPASLDPLPPTERSR